MKQTVKNSEVTVGVERAVFNVLNKVIRELKRQDKLRNEGKFAYTCRSRYLGESSKFLILTEEVGELSTSIMEERYLTKSKKTYTQMQESIQEELLQVCAVAFAWLLSYEDLNNEAK